MLGILLFIIIVVIIIVVVLMNTHRNNVAIDATQPSQSINRRSKVKFDERDVESLHRAITLFSSYANGAEEKFLEYFSQSLFFGNTRVEDCLALKAYLEKVAANYQLEHLHIALESALDVLNEHIK